MLNICFSISAFTWNALILLALRKCSIRPPPPPQNCYSAVSRAQISAWVSFWNSRTLLIWWYQKPPNICHLIGIPISIAGGIFCGVSSTKLTTISVERLLALFLVMRYRAVVTLKRVRILLTILWAAFCGISSVLFFIRFYIAVRLWKQTTW